MEPLTIPGYETLERIGEGGMAFVFKARQLSLGRLVAIKVLRRELAQDPTALAQFRLEANSVATLKHPHILQVHEAGEVDGVPYSVMEYVSAYSVLSWLARRGRLREDDALTIADSVARALEYAWDRGGLIHCDLKPGNILVDEDGLIKVADFSGLSRDRSSEDARRVAEMTIGTPNYMAPEQAHGIEDLDARVDIYALGAVLYHVVTGRMPFADSVSESETMRRQIEDVLPDPRREAPELSAPFVRLLECMLAKDRFQRYAGWPSFREDLARVRMRHAPRAVPPPAGGSTLRRDPDPARPPAQQPLARSGRIVVRLPADAYATPHPNGPPRRRRRRPGGLVLAALVLVALSLWLLATLDTLPWRPPPEDPAPPAHPPIDEPAPEPPAPPEAPPPFDPPPVRPLPEPPPETEPPPREAPELAAPDRAAVAFAELLEISQPALSSAQQREFAAAERRLRDWLVENRDHPHAATIRRDAARFASAAGLWRVLEQNAGALLGFDLTSGAGGTVTAVTRDGLRVRRTLGTGFADSTLPWSRLTNEDLLALLRRADPEQAPLHAAVLALAQVRVGAADTSLADAEARGLDTAELRAWQADWSARLREMAALRYLREAQQLTVASRFIDADARLRLLRERLADTEVVARHYAGDLAALEAAVQGEIQAPAPPPTLPAPEPEPDPDPEPDPENDDFAALDLGELARNLRDYDGRRVRFRIHYRTPITTVEPNRHRCHLGGREGMIEVEFPEEGHRFIRNLPVFSARGPGRLVYGVVDADRNLVVLIGRTRRIPMGPHPVEYVW